MSWIWDSIKQAEQHLDKVLEGSVGITSDIKRKAPTNTQQTTNAIKTVPPTSQQTTLPTSAQQKTSPINAQQTTSVSNANQTNEQQTSSANAQQTTLSANAQHTTSLSNAQQTTSSSNAQQTTSLSNAQQTTSSSNAQQTTSSSNAQQTTEKSVIQTAVPLTNPVVNTSVEMAKTEMINEDKLNNQEADLNTKQSEETKGSVNVDGNDSTHDKSTPIYPTQISSNGQPHDESPPSISEENSIESQNTDSELPTSVVQESAPEVIENQSIDTNVANTSVESEVKNRDQEESTNDIEIIPVVQVQNVQNLDTMQKLETQDTLSSTQSRLAENELIPSQEEQVVSQDRIVEIEKENQIIPSESVVKTDSLEKQVTSSSNIKTEIFQEKQDIEQPKSHQDKIQFRVENDQDEQNTESQQMTSTIENFQEKSKLSDSSIVSQKSSASTEGVNYKAMAEMLAKQLKDTKNLLTERERQLAERAVEQAKLHQEAESLKKSLESQEGGNKRTEHIIEKLKAEFSSRLGQEYDKISKLTKERDRYKMEANDKKSEMLLKEKDDIIAKKDLQLAKEQQLSQQLRTEGDNLSKKILSLQEANKKWKQLKEEGDNNILKLQETLKATNEELLKKHEHLEHLIHNEKEFQTALEEMRNVSGITAKQLEKREMDRASAVDQMSDLRHALEAAWADVAEAKKQNALIAQKHKQELEQREFTLKAEYHKLLTEQARADAKKEEELKATISMLRRSLEFNSADVSTRESNTQEEILQCHKKIQLLEQSNNELRESLSEATHPFLRQVAELESQLKANQMAFAILEKSLRSQINDAESSAIEARRELTEIQEQIQKWQRKSKNLEADNRTLKDAQQILQNKIIKKKQMLKIATDNAAKIKEQLLEEERTHIATVNSWSSRYNKVLQEMEHNKKSLIDTQHELQQIRKLREDDRNSNINFDNPSPVSSPAKRRIDEINNETLATISGGMLGTQKLLQTLEQKNGQVNGLQAMITVLEKSKTSLENELVALTTKNEELTKKIHQIKELEEENKDLKERFAASLELLGERQEKTNELSYDIDDFKQLYKQQIVILCNQVEDLSRENANLKKTLGMPCK